jgi:hypothetical protein
MSEGLGLGIMYRLRHGRLFFPRSSQEGQYQKLRMEIESENMMVGMPREKRRG